VCNAWLPLGLLGCMQRVKQSSTAGGQGHGGLSDMSRGSCLKVLRLAHCGHNAWRQNEPQGVGNSAGSPIESPGSDAAATVQLGHLTYLGKEHAETNRAQLLTQELEHHQLQCSCVLSTCHVAPNIQHCFALILIAWLCAVKRGVDGVAYGSNVMIRGILQVDACSNNINQGTCYTCDRG
jgi:hypothetical protein